MLTALRTSTYNTGRHFPLWVAALGLGLVQALVLLSVYLNLALYAAAAVAGTATVVYVLQRPAALCFLALGWQVFDKAIESHLHTGTNIFTYIGDGLLVAALVLTVVVNLMRRRHPVFTMKRIGLPLVAFVCLGIASALVNSVSIRVASLGILSTTHTLLIFLALVNVGVRTRDIERFMYVAIAVMGVISLIALLQVSTGSQAWKLAGTKPIYTAGSFARVSGVFDHPNVLGDYIAMVLPMGLMLLTFGKLGPRLHVLVTTCSLAMLGALLLAFTREAWAALPVATLFLGLTVERRLLRAFVLAILPGLAAIAVVFAPFVARIQSTSHGDARFSLFQRSVQVIADHPIFGVGPGMFGGHVAQVTNTPLYAQYNMTRLFYGTGGQIDMFWTHLIAESGFVGTAMYLAIIGACFVVGRRAYRNSADPRRRALLLGLLYSVPVAVFVSLVSPALEAGPPATLFWAITAMMTIVAADGDRLPVTRPGRPAIVGELYGPRQPV